jgi:hypothetical protein
VRIPLALAPGLDTDDTRTAAKGVFVDADKIRFHEKRAQTMGGWQRMMTSALTGVCRNMLAFADVSDVINTAFGTHSALQVLISDVLSDVTPTLALPPSLLATNPLATSVGTPLVLVGHPYHGLSTGASVAVSGAAAVGGITPNGTFPITVVDPSHYTFTFTSNATSTATGGGSAVQVQPQAAFAAGNVDGAGGAGWGAGSYGSGLFSAPSTAVTYARTWSLSAWGGSLMANPRGGTIYWWQNSGIAAPLLNAPAQVTCMIVPPNRRQVMAFGCTDLTGTWNPLGIRWSKLQDPTTWQPPDGTTAYASSTAGFDQLEGGGRIVAVKAIGEALIVWTNTAVYLGQYTGNVGQLWSFTRLADKCGLIGANSAVVVSQTAYWFTPGGDFWTYTLGAAPQLLPCPIRKDFFDNITPAQQDKIHASSISSGFSEVRWDYPDNRDGSENSRFLLYDTIGGEWSRGIMARTAAIDTGPHAYPLGANPSGTVFYHEFGQFADGEALSFSLETADLVLAGDPVKIREVWLDFQNQVGTIWLSIIARDHPQGTEKTYGPFACAPGASRLQLRGITTRIARLRLTSTAQPGFWRLGQLYVEAVPAGGLGRR